MKNLSKKALASSMFALCIGPAAYAQTKAAPAKKTTAASKNAAGFTKLKSGLQYKIVKHGTGKKKPAVTDHIEMYIHVVVGDSVTFDSRKMYGEKPVPYAIVAPKFKGDPVEGFMLMVAGDSAIFRLPVDSLIKNGGQAPPGMKAGQTVEWDVALVSVRTDAEEKAVTEKKNSEQKGIDDKLLQQYFTKNNLKPMKTASGIYYIISKEGTGEKVQSGQTVSVNYTGKLIDGKVFDSNEDSSFHHAEAFNVEVGKGRVIKGWDEGLQLLKKGSKATLYIPSGLAYGPTERNPIPANAILIFEVTILDVKSAEEAKKEMEAKQEQRKKEMESKTAMLKLNQDRDLKEYFAKNNIKATKTESGMYYSIIKEGTGENAKPGQKVTMHYLGKLLNGKVFDSNMDSTFTATPGKAPFTFALGQHQVIAGWDEGVQLLKKGSRGTFYLPSYLAYGERGAAGGAIPANAILIFDVELMEIE
jgi:FKBP-type peptidyl-prolyl cis-trans isomerase